jgi:arylsulfatase
MVPTADPSSAMVGPQTYHWTLVDNIRRDPFETAVAQTEKTFQGWGGALGAPATAYVYDWNILPLGQQLWLKELETYIKFPPLQNPESYNLTQVMQQVKDAKTHAGHD